MEVIRPKQARADTVSKFAVIKAGQDSRVARAYPPWVLQACVLLLVAANVINLAADLGAMGSAAAMAAGGPEFLYVLLFAAGCVGM
jgi:hypothetical protein